MDREPPSGFLYCPAVVGEAEAVALTERVRGITFSPVEMRGQVARRRTAHFGWVYGYESWKISPGPPLPEFLLPLRERAAALASVEAGALAEVLVTEYPAGAAIDFMNASWVRLASFWGPRKS